MFIGKTFTVKSYSTKNKQGGTLWEEKGFPPQIEATIIHSFYDYEVGNRFWAIVEGIETYQKLYDLFNEYCMSAIDNINQYYERVNNKDNFNHLPKDEYEDLLKTAELLHHWISNAPMFKNNFIIYFTEHDISKQHEKH